MKLTRDQCTKYRHEIGSSAGPWSLERAVKLSLDEDEPVKWPWWFIRGDNPLIGPAPDWRTIYLLNMETGDLVLYRTSQFTDLFAEINHRNREHWEAQ